MGYQALYRVWRPQNFKDVVGQKHVTKTLQNALMQGKISHAYLFSGPRGTGKTSAAKILAKAVNCENPQSGEPCNECDICKGISDGSIPDCIEIDAASNSGVNEIRDIRDKVKYAPNVAKYKVYIIDEVHMLSIEAFNALLKTLEEPPKHVIFILATTEPHKIPSTIISRCQRFDFKRISPQAIADRMRHILNDSSQSYEEEALQLIARVAEGGMRDALSLLDQAVSFSEDQLTVQDALLITGSVSQQKLNELAFSIVKAEPEKSIRTLHDLLSEGKDPSRIIEDLITYFRDLLLYQSSPGMKDYLERAVVDETFMQLAESYEKDQIFHIIRELNQAQQEMKWTNHAQIYLEVYLVKLSQRKKETIHSSVKDQIDLLNDKILSLEQEIQQLKEAKVSSPVQKEESRKGQNPQRGQKKAFKAPVGKIENILANATKQNLHMVKSNWAQLLEQLKRSHSALLNDAEPVAASDRGCVVKFKYDIHCQMAMNNEEFVHIMNTMLTNLFQKQVELVGVPEDQWGVIRQSFLSQHRDLVKDPSKEQPEGDPLIEEARKLVGENLLEIKD
ncbi:DNA polymerase III subunit gamma/tau [Fervidibacillus albus]|uniref:DNA-directed DNA polymerase n=1 Tax=Fervidibacillus albus TaxID=2980026 RepID=A0A9E8RW05_9BACI|nr:DNA polymerase III subunit gamma/tau [Fervidibacillus albus]WAA09513.1 DNA polymerase III subunit gamma/tau [Fervidibacillus albus]